MKGAMLHYFDSICNLFAHEMVESCEMTTWIDKEAQVKRIVLQVELKAITFASAVCC